SVNIRDYSHLFEEFGIAPFESLLNRIPNPHRLIRRGVIFGHRGYDAVLDAMLKGENFGVMSGFMPSGRAHLGSKMVMEEIIWHQQQGGSANVAIADIEARTVRKMPAEKCFQIGINDYLLSIIALGLEPGATIYFQSKMSEVKDLSLELAAKVNYSELAAIYGFGGDTTLAHLHVPVVQSADILLPQLNSPMPVVVPVGPDQDPHMRLTRELVDRINMFSVFSHDEVIKVYPKGASESIFESLRHRLRDSFEVREHEGHVDIMVPEGETGETLEDLLTLVRADVRKIELEYGGYAFVPPSSIYHRFMEGLTGGKMSSSRPESYISLTDSPEDAEAKVMRAKTGGRVSKEEQEKYGGKPEDCSVYSLLLFHLLEDDGELSSIYNACKKGERFCGACKKEAAELVKQFLYEHAEMRNDAASRIDDYNIVGYSKKYLKV
ncbi:MAG: tryptophan--tRNA ligase, partial [Methermicoccaceae archaeon]